ncbi:MAG: SDR family oxidoreductase [Candidatus Hodarchaeota archaeon]
MFFKEKKIIVTGAAGFIGSNLTDELLSLGAEVIGIDNLYNGRLENLGNALKSKNFQYRKGDIRDLNLLIQTFEDVDIIYHQAAFTSVPQSVEIPATCNEVNITGTLNVLNAARIKDVKKIIFATSSSVYGDFPGLPKKEDAEKHPLSPYGVSKLACEGYMKVYCNLYGLDTISLRYFNAFGPRQRDSPYSGVIAIWLGRILRNEDLIIYGDGKNSRDFTYIKDVIQANLLAAKSDVLGEIFNIGAGSPINLTELAKLMLKLTNSEHLKMIYTDPRPGDIIHSFADISKAKQILGYQPQYNTEGGLREYFKWYNKEYDANLKLN